MTLIRLKDWKWCEVHECFEESSAETCDFYGDPFYSPNDEGREEIAETPCVFRPMFYSEDETIA